MIPVLLSSIIAAYALSSGKKQQKKPKKHSLQGLGKLENKNIYKSINEQLEKAINVNDAPVWRKPWHDGIKIKGKIYGACNYITLRHYRGFNAFFIAMFNMVNKTNYTFFITEKEAIERGGKLKDKSNKGLIVGAYILTNKEEEKEINGETKIEKIVRSGIVSHKIFPIEYFENLKPIKRTKAETEDEDKKNIRSIEKPDKIINKMPNKPPIKHGGDRAFYTPSFDYVQMPEKKAFDNIEEYYSTLFHELIHSTLHKSRLNRNTGNAKFGSSDYAYEELIAEIGAAYLCGITGIEYYTLKNSAAYVKSWKSRVKTEIKANPKFFFNVMRASMKAVEYILGNYKKNKT